MRLFPRSLLGQMILLMGAVLLVAQLISLAFILNEHQKINLAQNEEPAIARFAETARQLIAAHGRDGEWRPAVFAGPGYSVSPASSVERMGLRRSTALEARLAHELAESGIGVSAVRAATRMETRHVRTHGHHRPGGGAGEREQKVAYFSARLGDGTWINGAVDVARPDFALVHRLITGTAILYLIVLMAAAWVAIRLGRPMRDLASAAEAFHGREAVAPVQPRGPSDVRRAIIAFNDMNARVSALLDQKDRMLGAIGHDLRTPLASIRIRAENMGPEAERTQLFATVDDMAEMLEDILIFARTGRPREPIQKVDIAALADAVVEEFRALGRHVTFRPSPRLAVNAQVTLLRRALRNLVENASTHAERSWVGVAETEDGVEIIVEDDGPGIPADQLAAVLEPFKRLDPSRARASGGAGLGLAIAAAVAQAHGGSLMLENRDQGGLRARLRLSSSPAD
jgi:signal transduction histidine kinase